MLLLLLICLCVAMKSMRDQQCNMINAFNSTSRYLDDLPNIDNLCFEQIVHRIYPTELQLKKAIFYTDTFIRHELIEL